MKRAILHVGTHKTGTTSIQSYLSRNASALERQAIYVPRSGRHDLSDGTQTPGHQLVPWGLIEGNESALVEVIGECLRSNAPCVVISSEELELLHDQRHLLQRLRDRLTDAGYDVTVIVYFREQAGYLESMYSEMMKRVRFMRFAEFFDDALRDGVVAVNRRYPVSLLYGTFLANWASLFGPGAIVARPYDARSPNGLIAGFLKAVALPHPELLGEPRESSTMENRRMTLGQIVVQLHWFATQLRGAVPDPIAAITYAGTTQHDPILGEPFGPLSYHDRVRVVERFARENARAEAEAGIRIPGTHVRDVPPSDDPRWEAAMRQRAILDAVTDFWFRR